MAQSRGPTVGVIGAGRCDAETRARAREVGSRLALSGCVVATGGLGGVMQAASEGAAAEGARVVGILPGTSTRDANPHVEIAIATGMGEARNAVLVNTCDGFVAVGGEYGTLSEIAFALKARKPVVSLGSWEVDAGIIPADTPEHAVALLLARLEAAGER
jgi:uncharacterized protein (TIGR00725 family)